MNQIYSQEIQEIIKKTKQFYYQNINIDYGNKTNPEKWSKKEILGHLIDSAINNLKRFTESQFFEEPYLIIPYKQNELVIVNKYQEQTFESLLNLWSAINIQIAIVVSDIDENLKKIIIFNNESKNDLEFLIQDYIVHLKHHLNQIFENEFTTRD